MNRGGAAMAVFAAAFAAGVCRASDDGWSGIVPLPVEEERTPNPADGTRNPGEEEGRKAPLPTPSLAFLGAIDLPEDAPEGLSGIAWLGEKGAPPSGSREARPPNARPGGTFAFAKDSDGCVPFAEFGFDAATGVPTSCVFTAVRTVPGAVDLEGVAFDPATGSLWLSDERGPSLFRMPAGGGTAPGPVRETDLLPPSLRRCRPNLSLEALGFDPVTRTLISASETAVEDDPDGFSRLAAMPVPDNAGKTASRAREWLVPLEPAPGAALPMLPEPFTGLCGLAPLPDGRLLALERTFGYEFAPGANGEPVQSLCRATLSLLDPDGGADPGPSGEAAPAGLPPVAGKQVLWKALTGNANFEGVCLGPALPDGGRLVVLVSDGDVSHRRGMEMHWKKSLLFLRLR